MSTTALKLDVNDAAVRTAPQNFLEALVTAGLLDRGDGPDACWRWRGDSHYRAGIRRLLYARSGGERIAPRAWGCLRCGCVNPRHHLSTSDRKREQQFARSRWRQQERKRRQASWRRRTMKRRAHLNELRRQSRAQHRAEQRATYNAWYRRTRGRQRQTGQKWQRRRRIQIQLERRQTP